LKTSKLQFKNIDKKHNTILMGVDEGVFSRPVGQSEKFADSASAIMFRCGEAALTLRSHSLS